MLVEIDILLNYSFSSSFSAIIATKYKIELIVIKKSIPITSVCLPNKAVNIAEINTVPRAVHIVAICFF